MTREYAEWRLCEGAHSKVAGRQFRRLGLEGEVLAQVKATQTHLGMPLPDGCLALGTWQGGYLIEHRHAPHRYETALYQIGKRLE